MHEPTIHEAVFAAGARAIAAMTGQREADVLLRLQLAELNRRARRELSSTAPPAE
jgi:hypothetical protein